VSIKSQEEGEERGNSAGRRGKSPDGRSGGGQDFVSNRVSFLHCLAGPMGAEIPRGKKEVPDWGKWAVSNQARTISDKKPDMGVIGKKREESNKARDQARPCLASARGPSLWRTGRQKEKAYH